MYQTEEEKQAQLHAGLLSRDDVVIHVDQEKTPQKIQFDKDYVAFEKAIAGTVAHVESGRSKADALMVLLVLGAGIVASYGSYKFASDFMRKMLGPDEGDVASWLREPVAKVFGCSAYSANAAIPVISSDVALIGMLNIMGCLATGVVKLVVSTIDVMSCGHCKTPGLDTYRKKREWHGWFTAGYSIFLLGLSVVGSVANTEAGYNAVEDEKASWLWAVTITTGIVQLLQNGRAVKLLFSNDTSHFKQYRIEQQNKLLSQHHQKTPEQIHALSFGQDRLLPMWGQVTLLTVGLVAACVYNYTAAIKPILKNNENMGGWQYGLAGANFLVKTVLFTRATTKQTRRIFTLDRYGCCTFLGLAGLVVLGVTTMGSGAQFPKKYAFNDDNDYDHSWISLGLATFACIALNLGDLVDASKIILGFAWNTIIKQGLFGMRQSVTQRLGFNFEGFIEKSIQKTKSQDELLVFHHKPRELDHDPAEDDVCKKHVAIIDEPRSWAMTASNLQAPYRSRATELGNFVEREHVDGKQYHVKDAGVASLDSWEKLKQLKDEISRRPEMKNGRGEVDEVKVAEHLNKLYIELRCNKQRAEDEHPPRSLIHPCR